MRPFFTLDINAEHTQALRFHNRYMTGRDWLTERQYYPIAHPSLMVSWVFHNELMAQLRQLKPGRLP